MALKGNLQDFSTTQLLNLVHLARKSGALQVDQDSQTAELFFQEGKIIFASLTGFDGLLTAMLARAGKLSPGQAKAIQSRTQERDDKRLAMILIQNGYVSKEDVVQSATQYVLDVVYRLFTWTFGEFFFEPSKQPDRNRLVVPIDLGNVIMEGSRRVQEWERLQDELPDLDMALKFTDRPDAKLRNISLSAEEWKVISYVKPANSIRRIAQANNMNDFQIRRIVYGMLQAGLVELIRPPGMPVEQKAPESRTARAPQITTPTVKRGIVNKLISRIKSM
ncbi:MAG: DUF4388 domain-containing protein [Anaerolineae bacterium]|nr:DUF4388 domain-containing protein [Anaerolineae bacterium]